MFHGNHDLDAEDGEGVAAAAGERAEEQLQRVVGHLLFKNPDYLKADLRVVERKGKRLDPDTGLTIHFRSTNLFIRLDISPSWQLRSVSAKAIGKGGRMLLNLFELRWRKPQSYIAIEEKTWLDAGFAGGGNVEKVDSG